jgi:hypothetical protein
MKGSSSDRARGTGRFAGEYRSLGLAPDRSPNVRGLIPQIVRPFGDGRRRDFLAINADGLPKIHEMRRSVEAHPAARGPKHRIISPNDAASWLSWKPAWEASWMLQMLCFRGGHPDCA